LVSLLVPAVAAANGGSDSTNVNLNNNLLQAKEIALRSFLVEKAKQYQGLSYRYGGVSPKTGFDCSGFTSFVMKQFNILLDHSSRSQGSSGERTSLEECQSGDLIVFRRSSRSGISHVAMVVSNGPDGLFIIHSCSRGILIENLYESKYWRPKVYMVRDVVSGAVTQAVIPDNLFDEIALPEGLAKGEGALEQELSEEDRSVLTALGRQLPFMVAAR
jgi:hypothetical protein